MHRGSPLAVCDRSTKAIGREQARARLREFAAHTAQRDAASRAIVARLCALPCYARSQRLLLFLSMSDEVQLASLAERAFDDGKQVYAPRIQGDLLQFYRLDAQTVCTRGRYGIAEPPATDPPFDPLTCADRLLIVVPALALTADGTRLGRGGGYYDRFLSSLPDTLRATVVCPCFDCQLCDCLPTEAHDVRVPIVVTERAVHGITG